LLLPARVVDVDMIDISEAGVCMTSPVELAPGTWCHLRIEMPVVGTDFSLSGQVCFCIERQGAFRIGVHCPHSESLAAVMRGNRS
jgi:PilZ domain-containing protein